MKVEAKCKRSLDLWDSTGCGTIHFHCGEKYLFNVNETVELDGLIKVKRYSISLPQQGIIGNPKATVHFFNRPFASCLLFDDYFYVLRTI